MEPKTFYGRLLAYALLLSGSFVFLFPFLWLVSTSLKPNEQAVRIPPQWIPMDYTITETDAEGRPRVVHVIRGEALGAPSLIVRVSEGPYAGKKMQVEPDMYRPDEGTLRMTVAGINAWYPAEMLYRAEKGWHYIERRREEIGIEHEGEWDYVPPERIDEAPRLFWENYHQAMRKMGMATVVIPLLGWEYEVSMFWVYLRNTLIVCVLGVIGTVLSSSLVAYSLARIPWRGRGVLFAITLATMMIPFPVLMVPLYTLFKTFGWIGTLLPLWVPMALGTGFNIFLLRQFFLTIPRDLSEAARIDGCSEFGIYWRIILPLSKPALAVVALFHFLFSWNDFMGPLLYLTRESTYTLSLGLQHFQSSHGGVDWSSLMAMSTLICLPIIVLFFFTQKTFIKGIATTGIKG